MRKDVKPACSRKPVFWFVRCALMAAPLVLAAFHAQPANAEISEEMAGVSAAVTGDVTMARTTGEVGVLVESGMPVYLGDRITTSGNSGMQILLLDETVFTIGPNSDIAIDEFVYDPASGNGRIVADMARGVMRFVTGKIPLNNPSSMDINLPVGSIGIRGTIGLIRSVSAEQANEVVPGSFDTSTPEAANQQVFMAVNQGPGLQRNDTTSRPGAFAVNDQNGNSENVTGENFGVFVSNGAVTTPTRFPENIGTFDFSTNLVRTASRSNAPAGSDGGSSGSTSDTNSSLTPSQSQQADTQTGATMAGSIEVAMAQVGATQATSSQGEITEILGNVDSSSSSSSSDGSSSPFTFDGLRDVTSGTVSTGTVNASNGALSYSFSTAVDFSNRLLTIQFTSIQDGVITAILPGEAKITAFNFSGTTGNAAFSSGDFTYSAGCIVATGCSASATFTDASNIDFELKTNAVPAGASGSADLN